MTALDTFYVHTGTVETLTGSNADGDVLSNAVTVTGLLDDQTRVVISPEGDTVTSASTFYTTIGNQALFVPRSRFTINGRVCTVLDVRVRAAGSLGLPEHVEVVLN